MNDIQTIAAVLFEPSDIVELRAIKSAAPHSEVVKKWTTAAELPSMESELAELNRRGFNIYFGVNPRKERGQSGDRNVLLARCLFCDFDNVEPGDGCGRLEFIWTEIFLAGLPEPTLCIHSGHGLHTYWRLDEPIYDLTFWRSMQDRLNRRLGADITIKNPERIMRLPGFINTKKIPHQDCFICWGENYANR